MLGRNKKVAREEYLTSIGDKSAFCFESQEKNIILTDISEDTTGIVHLKVTSEGYGEIEVYSEDRMIGFDRKVVTTDEFTDGTLDFSFKILAASLHSGKNFGRIVFRTPVCRTQVNITVDNSLRLGFSEKSAREKTAALCRAYVDLRLGNLFQTEWQEKTLGIIGDVNGGNVADMFLMLYKANVLISMERYTEAKNLIEFVGIQMQKLPERNWDLLAYFYYISSLYEMDEAVTADSFERVKDIYGQYPSWKILWILFYLDASLNNSPRSMFEAMEGEFLLRGMRSPVMYYEAMECLKKDTDLISEPSSLVIQTLNFAAREDYLSIAVCIKFAEVIWRCDDALLQTLNKDTLVNILKSAYDRFGSNIILKSLCRVLVAKGSRDTEFHEYFAKAIAEFLETKEIYNYFIYTADHEKFVQLPEAVLEFFAGREYELGPDRDYYFACLIKDKHSHREYLSKAMGNMVRSAGEAIDKGLVSTALAVVYRELMDTDRLPAEKYQRMLEILCSREVVTKNKLVESVLVFHREFNEYSEAQLKEGRALIRIYSRDAVVLFKDSTGNLYYAVDYVQRKFLPKREYAEKCIKNSLITRYMMVGDNLDVLRSVKGPMEVLDYLHENIGKGSLRSVYEQEILKGAIAYFSKNSLDKAVYDKLLEFLQFNLENSTRARLIEVMIDKMMYREAYEEIEKNGYEEISEKHICTLVHVLAEVTDYERDDCMNALAAIAFMNSEYDPVIFKYLSRRYDDRMDVLILMYVQAMARGLDSLTIGERILRKVVETGKFPKEAESIFAIYFADGTDNQLKKDFMAFVALRHLYSKDRKYEFIFGYLENAMGAGEAFADNVVVSYLLYMKGQAKLERKNVRIIEEHVNRLVRKGIMLEEFKAFRHCMELPAILTRSVIAQVIVQSEEERTAEVLTKGTMFGSAPRITFEVKQRGTSVKGVEAMKEVCTGCYTKVFTLFYGESVEYRVEDGERKLVDYSDLNMGKDSSMYAQLDNMIKLFDTENGEKLQGAMLDYKKKNMLIKELF